MIKKWADRFFRWYCRPEYYADIRGDLEELYQQNILSHSKRGADLRFVKQVLLLLRLSIIKPIHVPSILFHSAMFVHHLKIAFRQLVKQKLFSAIKIGGFSLGVAACLLLGLFVMHESSYDAHYQDTDRLYRIFIRYLESDGELLGIHVPPPFASAIKKEFPEIEQVARFAQPAFITGNSYIKIEGQLENVYEEGFSFFDPELLEILEIPMIYGNVQTALSQPNSIVISESKANTYFPGENPIGKILILNNDDENPTKIGGVMKDFPARSHLSFDFILTLEGVEFWPGEQSQWSSNNYVNYLKLKPGIDPQVLEEKLALIKTKYFLPSWQASGYANAETYVDSMDLELQAVSDIYLQKEPIRDQLVHGDRQFVWLFIATMLVILLIACINFINLSTAKSSNRAKEVGMRKVIGAHRNQIAFQFLTESILYSLFSFGLGLLLAYLFLPYFNFITDRSLSIPWNSMNFIPGLIGSAMIIGVLSGAYPSIYLSAFRPINVLKGNLSKGAKHPLFRSGMVMFQFTTTVVLIICTMVIYQQVNYILTKKVGYDKDHVITLKGLQNIGEQAYAMKDEITQLPQVHSASLADYLPISGTRRNGNGFFKEGRTTEDPPVSGQIWRVDMDYVSTLGINVIQGRDFSPEFSTDSQAVIINESMVYELGLEDPINERITNGAGVWTVIGVVEDFHFESMRQQVDPVALVVGSNRSMLSIRVEGENISATIASVKKVWKDFAPHQPIQYSFLDEQFAMMYADIERSGKLFNSFSLFAVIIACMGLFGLTAFMSEQRNKEVGIRKVLGASVRQIISLLSSHFLLLTFFSILLAIPIAYYLMQRWLEGFEYRIDMPWEVYVLAGGITLVIAFATMSYHVLKTAVADPIESLRTE